MNDKNLPQPFSFWVELLQDGILLSDVDDGTASALCRHLADLEVLARVGEEGWKLTPCPESSLTIKEELDKRLQDLCAVEQGFALHYFLQDAPDASIANGAHDSESSETGDRPETNSKLLDRTTSNLSNLQIVKKYGRQMESFIELEEKFTKKLLGEHTTLKEARKIFNFILSRMKQKAEPRPWEQLSRRRHK